MISEPMRAVLVISAILYGAVALLATFALAVHSGSIEAIVLAGAAIGTSYVCQVLFAFRPMSLVAFSLWFIVLCLVPASWIFALCA